MTTNPPPPGGRPPFSPETSLHDNLVAYMHESLEWLAVVPEAGNGTVRRMRAIVSENPWEVAYSIRTVLRVHAAYPSLVSLDDGLGSLVVEAVEFVLDYLEAQDEVTESLDGNPYDTGVATSALAEFRAALPNHELSERMVEQGVLRGLASGIESFLIDWVEDRTLAEFDDVAVLLSAMRTLEKTGASMTARAQRAVDRAVSELVADLRQSGGELRSTDVYSLSLVLVFLSECEPRDAADRRVQGIGELLESIRAHLESAFDGNWDQPPDTALALQAYVKSAAGSSFRNRDEIVLVALRWLSESKQRYKNGSIQHSVHYTCLYIEALLACLQADDQALKGGILEGSVWAAYDSVLRSAALRRQLDRSETYALSQRIVHFEEIERAQKRSASRRAMEGSIAYWLAAVVVLVWLAWLLGAFKDGVVTQMNWAGPIPGTVDWPVFGVLFSVWFAASGSVFAFLRGRRSAK